MGKLKNRKERESITCEAILRRLRKDFSIWLKSQDSKFSFQSWLERMEGNDKASSQLSTRGGGQLFLRSDFSSWPLVFPSLDV